MEVKGNYEVVQHHWVQDEDDTCVSSISNVSDPNKERRKIERAASKACITGIPENIGDGIDAKAPSKTLQELIREIKKSSSSPPPIEIDQAPPPIIEVEHPPSQSPDPDRPPLRSGSSSRHEKKSSRHFHRRASVETPRIQTRRASMGGTTLYQTSHMAKIDSFLRGSELRLNKNGTCSFVYEDKKFTIETTAENNQFLFHCSLGRLVQWKKMWAKKLLHMMALWNEEQITKSDKEGNDQDSKYSEADEDPAEQEVGLLRIDSSKDNPVVALILYGHADNIKSATQFQDMLDEFVDDALHFYGKLKAGPEMEEVKEVEEPKPSKSLSSKLAKEEDPKRHCKSLSSNTCSTAALTSSLTSSEPPEVANAPASTQLNQPEISQDRASPAPSASSDQDERTSNRKASVFGNIIKNLRSRHKEDIGKLAFIDPNQNSAFVVDTNAADAVKINISRQSRRWDSAHDTEENQPKSNLKRGSTFDVQTSRSRRSSAPTDENQPNSNLKRGCTIDDGHRVQPKKGSSFNIEDRTRGPTKKSASLLHDDSSRLASLNKSASNLSRREPRSRSSRFNKSEPALVHNRGDEMASPSGKDYQRHQTSEHHRRKRTSSRPRRKVHCNESMGEEDEKNRSRSRRSKSQARVPGAPPSRPPELERSSRSRSVSRKEFERSRSRSAFRKNGRSRSRSALRTEL
jgi:acylphosphatase